MANRNVSQLPENTDPQDTDWLLGASGNSPSVLQKMAVGNIKPANTGSGGSIKFALPINENYTLTSSGYYFTDAIADNITIDCSNLAIGDHIYWLNLSSKSVFFSGLNSIDSVQIPANKGIRVIQESFIQFIIKDSNKNTKKLSGNHSIDWLPGQGELGSLYWRVDFNRLLSEIQFYYDYDDDSNPKITLNGSNIISFTRSSFYSESNLQYNNAILNDGSYSGFTGNLNLSDGKQSYIINIPQPKRVSALHLASRNDTSGHNPTIVDLYKGEDPSTWILVKTWTGSPLNMVPGQGSKFLVS